MSTDYSDILLYGKDSTLGVVSMEINDSSVDLYIQKEDGTVECKVIENYPWILCDRDLGGMVRLKGEQHYKFGRQFKTIDEFQKFYNMNCRRADLYTIHNLKENCMVNKGITYFKGINVEDISILSFDIETNGLAINKDSVVYLISNTFKSKKETISKLFSLDEYPNQVEMIKDWCKWVNEKDPTILVGHNINSFDIPMLMSITDLNIGRNGSNIEKNKKESKFRIDGSMDLHYHKLYCYGREIIDTLFLSYRYDAVKKKYESYGLKNIIRQEGLEKEGRTFVDSSKIYKEWEDKEKRKLIKQYAVEDADDALKLFYLMIPPFFYMTQIIPKPFQVMLESATGSQINALMVRSYLQQQHSIAKATEIEKFEGAISFAIPGIYRNVFKVDVASLYPSIIRTYKIYDKDKDPQGNFLKLADTLTLTRLRYKKLHKDTGEKIYDHLQNTFKIAINSMYGFMGASGLNYNSIRNAEAVTRYGREVLAKAIEWATSKPSKYWTDQVKGEEDGEEDV